MGETKRTFQTTKYKFSQFGYSIDMQTHMWNENGTYKDFKSIKREYVTIDMFSSIFNSRNYFKVSRR